MEILGIFAGNVKKQRMKKELTQAGLADRAELHVTYINAVENCRRNISLTNVERIARALGVEAYELFQPLEKEGK